MQKGSLSTLGTSFASFRLERDLRLLNNKDLWFYIAFFNSPTGDKAKAAKKEKKRARALAVSEAAASSISLPSSSASAAGKFYKMFP